MKIFPEHQITVSKEEYDQLVECRDALKGMFYANCLSGNRYREWTLSSSDIERINKLEGLEH